MARRDGGKRVDKDPIGAEDAWLRATQESTGEMYERPALDKVLGEPHEEVSRHADETVINGYPSHNPSLNEPPGPDNTPDAGGRPEQGSGS
jgi:hypothetical protein